MYIHDGKAELKDAAGLWGLDTAATLERLNKAHGIIFHGGVHRSRREKNWCAWPLP